MFVELFLNSLVLIEFDVYYLASLHVVNRCCWLNYRGIDWCMVKFNRSPTDLISHSHVRLREKFRCVEVDSF